MVDRIRRLPSLNSLRAFEATARNKSFSQAAMELNVTQGAVSRQIKTLEEYLGVMLFRRLPRSLELTDEGLQYAAPLRQAFESMYHATEAILDGHRKATLNVTVLPTFGMRWLNPRLLNFTAANPLIEIRMMFSIAPADFRVEGNDIAIRVGPVENAGRQGIGESSIDLVMTNDWTNIRLFPLVADRLAVLCSPGLRDGNPPLREPKDLKFHTLLHTASRERSWPAWLRAKGLDDDISNKRLEYGHFFMAIQAAIEGKGVAVIPRILAEAEIKSGTLVVPFPGTELTVGTYYLLCRDHQGLAPKVERFREWIMSEVAATDALAPV
jgi:LysR family transcriptional regulator, glycine cleavage system transcriptional activator